MSGTTTVQPRWGRALGAFVAVVILIALSRGAWEVVVGTVLVTVLVGGYALQRRARRAAVYEEASK